MSGEIQVRVEMNHNTAIINLVGDVTTFAEKNIIDAYQQVLEQKANHIIFNFRENDYINSGGIAILISVVTKARKNNQRLLIAMPNSHFQKIFQMVGLTQYANIYGSLEEATNSLAV